MGFTYDCYVTADQLERVSEEERARFCAARFCWTTTDLRLWQPAGTPARRGADQPQRGRLRCRLCRPPCRRCGSVYRDGHRLTAKTAYGTDELVFFSVPYDDGFSATVNGEPAAIEKVDDGLMAVYVRGGERDRIYLHTPGLKVSACVSAAAIAVYGVYLLGIIKRKSQPGSKR